MKIQEQISKSKIELWKISDLLPYARNSRTHSDSQIAKVAASIKEFGFTSPILIKSSGEIIAGHCRLEASRKLKLDSVPCIVLDHLTDIQARAYVIADNQLALNAGWDEEMLKLEIEDLREADFDLDLLGFDENDMSELNDEPESDEDDDIEPVQIKSMFEIVVVCSDESNQEQVYKKLTEEGYQCRVLSM